MSNEWVEKKLGEVCEISSKLVDPREPEFIKLPHIGAGNMISGTGKLIDIKTAKEEGLKSGKFLFNRTMVLYSKIRPYLMKVARPEFGGLCSADVYPLLPDTAQLNRDFLFHLLLSREFTEYAIEGSSRVGMPKVNRDHLFNFTTYLPPVHEQKRIVAIVDETFEGIDRAIANTENNLTNARELFESYLNTIFTQKGDGWVEKTVGEIADHSLGKMLDKEKNKGVFKPYLRNFNVRWFEFDLSDLLEMRFEESEWEKYTAVKGDVLICEGGYPGRAAIWQEDEPIFFQKAIHRVRFKDFTYSKWFLYFIYLADCNGELKKYFTGAGIQHFTGQSLHRFKLPMPPLSVIEKFVEQFDELRLKTQHLESIYQQKIAALNELKQSILQKAFTGELTADTTQQATRAVKEVVAA